MQSHRLTLRKHGEVQEVKRTLDMYGHVYVERDGLPHTSPHYSYSYANPIQQTVSVSAVLHASLIYRLEGITTLRIDSPSGHLPKCRIPSRAVNTTVRTPEIKHMA